MSEDTESPKLEEKTIVRIDIKIGTMPSFSISAVMISDFGSPISYEDYIKIGGLETLLRQAKGALLKKISDNGVGK